MSIKHLLGKYLLWIGTKTGIDSTQSIISNLSSYVGKNAVVYLDCGCADGDITLKIANTLNTKIILSIELLPYYGKLSRKKGITVYLTDLNKKLPFSSNSIDVITALQVIEPIIEIDLFLSELKRVLKKNGLLILTTENLASWHNVFSLLRGNQPYSGPYISKKVSLGRCTIKANPDTPRTIDKNDMPGHTNVMTTKTLAALCKGFGFTIEKITGIDYYPFPPPLANILAHIDIAHCVHPVIILKKQS